MMKRTRKTPTITKPKNIKPVEQTNLSENSEELPGNSLTDEEIEKLISEAGMVEVIDGVLVLDSKPIASGFIYDGQVKREEETVDPVEKTDTVKPSLKVRLSNYDKNDFTKRVEERDFAFLDLKGNDFSNQDMRACNFEGSDLTVVKFTGAILQGCNFEGANLTDTDFEDADTRWSTLNGTE